MICVASTCHGFSNCKGIGGGKQKATQRRPQEKMIKARNICSTDRHNIHHAPIACIEQPPPCQKCLQQPSGARNAHPTTQKVSTSWCPQNCSKSSNTPITNASIHRNPPPTPSDSHVLVQYRASYRSPRRDQSDQNDTREQKQQQHTRRRYPRALLASKPRPSCTPNVCVHLLATNASIPKHGGPSSPPPA